MTDELRERVARQWFARDYGVGWERACSEWGREEMAGWRDEAIDAADAILAEIAKTHAIVPLDEVAENDEPNGCGYTGYEFGAHYPDSICIDGYLWDLDSCDEPGGSLSRGGEISCPRCKTVQFLESALEDARDGSCGSSMTRPWCAAVVWEHCLRKAHGEQPAITAEWLAKVEPFVTTDWPDREAVYQHRAEWDNTIKRQWPWHFELSAAPPVGAGEG